jgi:hypothetical protein
MRPKSRWTLPKPRSKRRRWRQRRLSSRLLRRIGLTRIVPVDGRQIAVLEKLSRSEPSIGIFRRLASHGEAAFDEHAQRFIG